MALLHGELNVLRIEVPAADDDQLFAAACNEELALVEEAQVASSNKGPFSASEVCSEGLLRFLRLVPVPLGDVRTRHPYFSHLAHVAAHQLIWVDDHDFLPI